jgi:hypothetical protein
MPTTLQSSSHQSPHHAKLALQMLVGFVVTLTIAGGIVYAEALLLGANPQFNALAMLLQ